MLIYQRVHAGLTGKCPTFSHDITQLEEGYHLQILESDVKQIPKRIDIYQPLCCSITVALPLWKILGVEWSSHVSDNVD